MEPPGTRQPLLTVQPTPGHPPPVQVLMICIENDTCIFSLEVAGVSQQALHFPGGLSYLLIPSKAGMEDMVPSVPSLGCGLLPPQTDPLCGYSSRLALRFGKC